jgi:DNA-directed RNA polymerase subunit RPC12/RpoP
VNEENKDEKKQKNSSSTGIKSCPHCGRELSPWEQILLSVDRMLMCKGCWYRIISDVFPETKESEDEKNKGEHT